jgi:hypothetical protein
MVMLRRGGASRTAWKRARVLALFGIWLALVVVVIALCRLAGRGTTR